MKKLGLAIISGSILAACAPQGPAISEELQRNLTVRDSLKTEVGKLNELIASFEAKIAEQDTTIKLTPVTTEKALVKTFEHYFEVHGSVQAEENASLYAEAPGTVTKIHVTEGQSVKKGQLLISLDAGPARSQLEELQKGLELATKVYDKQAKLWEQKIGTELQYLEAKNNKESLEQRLVTVKEQIDMYNIRAPFDGVIDQIFPKVGEAAAPGFPVARILNLAQVYLESDVSEAYMNTLAKGGLVKVFFPSLNEEVEARITRTGNYINPANRTFKVRVSFPNAAGKYKPNQLAVLRIRDFIADNAVVIPSRVIQQDRAGKDYVYTISNENGQAIVKKLLLETGMNYNGETLVVSGIEGNQVYVDKGAKSVQAGDEVEVKNAVK